MRGFIIVLGVLLVLPVGAGFFLYSHYFYETIDHGRSKAITYAVRWAVWDHLYGDGRNETTRRPLNTHYRTPVGPRGMYCTTDEFHEPTLPFGSCVYIGTESLERTEACSLGKFFRSCVAISVDSLLYNDPAFRKIFDSVMYNPCSRIPDKDRHEFGCRGKSGPFLFDIVVTLSDYDPASTAYRHVSEVVYEGHKR